MRVCGSFSSLPSSLDGRRKKMEAVHQQTWWNKNAASQIREFQSWVGDASAPSKVYMAMYLKSRVSPGYKTLLDAGCGTGTFYDTLQQSGLPIAYTGADSCAYFIQMNRDRGIVMLDADLRRIPVPDGTFDVAFSRHTFEHQPCVDDILLELVRVGRQEMCHIFFIKPLVGSEEREHINWDRDTNLYHNTYTRVHIESLLTSHKRVRSWKWVDINDQECALHVYLNPTE